MYYTMLGSPRGDLLLVGDSRGLQRLYRQASTRPGRVDPTWVRDDEEFSDARQQLQEYFAGTRHVFKLQLNPDGTAFAKRVWTALLDIPYGDTTTYGHLATTVGRARGARAVGAANGRNPIPIIIPCHRVVGADGSLTGYGGGILWKQFLLDHEALHRDPFTRGRQTER